MINVEQKQQIKNALVAYIEQKGSQNKASKTIGVSGATLSQIVNGNWENIADEMWRKVSAQIGNKDNEWVIVRTRDFQLIEHLLTDAKEHSNVYGIVGEAGSGKSEALKAFEKDNPHTYLLDCNEFWNRKYFLAEMLTAMGRDYSGLTVAEMMNEVVRLLKSQPIPLLMLNEADKLSDQVLYFFITLYNLLEGHCGIILIATDHLEKRIKRGLKLNKKGYKEIYSRIGRKFIELKGVGSSDIQQICIANGIEDNKLIKEIIEDSEFDLRRVKRKIHALKIAA